MNASMYVTVCSSGFVILKWRRLPDPQISASFMSVSRWSRSTTVNIPTKQLSRQRWNTFTSLKRRTRKTTKVESKTELNCSPNSIIRLELEKLFSGEESLGRYLDLNALHTLYINLKGVKKLDYLQYLSEFDHFATNYPKSIKSSEEYKTYINQLFDYLHSFFRRAKPLYNIAELEEEALEEFNRQWELGQVKGWEQVDTKNEELFCPACQKQFSKKTVYDAHLTAKKHIKAQKKLEEEQGSSDSTVVVKDDKRKAIAWKERLIAKYAEALADFREESKSNVERKQALTDKERLVSTYLCCCPAVVRLNALPFFF